MYLCGPGKHSCQPFCGPEGRFYCSDSVCSLWPAPFSYLCVSVMILWVCWKLSAAEQVKTDCCNTPAIDHSLHFIDSAACVLSFDHSTPLHITITIQRSVREARHTQRLALKQSVGRVILVAAALIVISSPWIQLSFYSTQYLIKVNFNPK